MTGTIMTWDGDALAIDMEGRATILFFGTWFGGNLVEGNPFFVPEVVRVEAEFRWKSRWEMESN